LKYPGDNGEDVDLVLFGCPHLTISEIDEIAGLLEGKKLKTRMWLGTAEPVLCLARKTGYTEIIEKAGGVFARTCIASVPHGKYPKGIDTIATNSFKASYFISKLAKKKIICGSFEECVSAAITGKWRARR
jgi:predicted aconitase